MTKIKEALEAAGIIFIDGDGTHGPGVRLRDPQTEEAEPKKKRRRRK